MTAAMTAIMYTGREPKRGYRKQPEHRVGPTHSETQPTVVLFLAPSHLLARFLMLSRSLTRRQCERFVGIKFGCTT